MLFIFIKFIHNHQCSYSYTNVYVTVHNKSANINVTVHIKSANINVTFVVNYLLMLLILFDFMKNQRFSHKQNKFLAVRQAFAIILYYFILYYIILYI